MPGRQQSPSPLQRFTRVRLPLFGARGPSWERCGSQLEELGFRLGGPGPPSPAGPPAARFYFRIGELLGWGVIGPFSSHQALWAPTSRARSLSLRDASCPCPGLGVVQVQAAGGPSGLEAAPVRRAHWEPFLFLPWLRQRLQEAQPPLGRASVSWEAPRPPLGTRTCQREGGVHGAWFSEVSGGLVTSVRGEGMLPFTSSVTMSTYTTSSVLSSLVCKMGR